MRSPITVKGRSKADDVLAVAEATRVGSLGFASIGNEGLDDILGEAGLEFGLGLLDLGGQVITDLHRLRPPPVGQVIVGLVAPPRMAAMSMASMKRLSSMRFSSFRPALTETRMNVAPIGDEQVRHDGLLYRRFRVRGIA